MYYFSGGRMPGMLLSACAGLIPLHGSYKCTKLQWN